MFRNQYDTDVTVWSPEGRLLQVEYAMESVKQGSACVGIRSDSLVVLAALKRSVSELSSHQKKIMEIDSHMAIAIAGLTADARSLAKWMRNESMNHKYVYGTGISPQRLLAELADKHQRTTQTYVRRPYGVGLLVASYEEKTGPHLHQTCPSGNLYEYYATAMGARSQSGRTYLETLMEKSTATATTTTMNVNPFADMDASTLILHALKALHGCVSSDTELNQDNASVVMVGKGCPYTLLEGPELQYYMDQLELDQQAVADGAASEPGTGAAGADDDMEEDVPPAME